VLGLVRLYPHQVLRFELKRLRFLLVNAVYLAKTRWKRALWRKAFDADSLVPLEQYAISSTFEDPNDRRNGEHVEAAYAR